MCDQGRQGEGIVVRDELGAIVEARDRVVELWEQFFAAIEKAHDLRIEAETILTTVTGEPAGGMRYIGGKDPEIEAFRAAIEMPNTRGQAMASRRLTDIAFWEHVIKRTRLEVLMDQTAKAELHRQMRFVPEKIDPKSGVILNQDDLAKSLPALTTDTVEATLEQFSEDAGMIWRRGIASAFASLDRRFRSHDGFKIKDRIILQNTFDTRWGGWSVGYSGRDQRDRLIDIERVFLLLDGKTQDTIYGGIVGAIDAASKARELPGVVEGDYFRVRTFKNGNAHLWMTRKDLVVKVNRLLGEYYGAGLGWGKDAERSEDEKTEDLFGRAVMRPVARNFGLFPTPDAVAERVMDAAALYGKEPLTVLEPSAGTGALARRCVQRSRSNQWERIDPPNRVDVVEIQPELCRDLDQEAIYRRVIPADFLTLSPDPIYDRVVMNPPFDSDRWADHLHHAIKFIKPGGRLVAVLPQCAEFSQTSKAKAVRRKIHEIRDRRVGWPRHIGVVRDGIFVDLPEGSFREAGTYVNTLICTFVTQ